MRKIFYAKIVSRKELKIFFLFYLFIFNKSDYVLIFHLQMKVLLIRKYLCVSGWGSTNKCKSPENPRLLEKHPKDRVVR